MKREPSKLVAIVVPLSNRAGFTAEEIISLNHLERYLGHYDKYMVAPQSLDIKRQDFIIKKFNNRYFGSIKAHKNLVLSKDFYKAFDNYKFILIYHLDSLVFKDKLEYWCDMDFDYIGAPWVAHEEAPYYGMPEYEDKVGNGGFALKKVESFLKIVTSKKLFVDPNDYWQKTYAPRKRAIRYLNFHKKILKHLHIFNGVRQEIQKLRHNSEELFLVQKAKHYYPDFRIAPLKIALSFAFESVPRHCYQLNNFMLPFGCHAWHKYDRDFWEPYLLKSSYCSN
jgi:hypothetical protein